MSFFRFLFRVTCAVLACAEVLVAQLRIASVGVRGNSHFSQRELLQALPIAAGREYSVAALRGADSVLIARYRSDGFYFARIDSLAHQFSPDSQSVALTYYLHEGEQAVLREFVLRGVNSFPPDEVKGGFETSTGRPLSQSALEADFDNLLTRYENTGRPLAAVHVDSIRIDSTEGSGIRLAATVNEGPKVYLKEITAEGNTSTKSYVIAREASIHGAEVYDQEKVERYRRKLERLGMFSSVGEPRLYLFHDPSGSDSVGGGLVVPVQEGSTNSFDGIIGYAPPTGNGQSGYLTGNVLVSMRNLFGSGRKAMVQWQRENPYTQQIEAHYEEPWVAGYPVNLGAGIFQRKQDSTYIKTQYTLRADLSLTDELSLAGTLTDESVDPSADLNYFTVFESSLLSLGGEIHYDTRDNVLSPRSGVNYSTTYSRGSKRISGPPQYLELATGQNFLVEQFTVDLETYLPTFTRQVLLVGFHGRKISSSQLEMSDLFQIGGINSVRGYRENQFFGSQVVWSNLEYRFLVGRYSSLFGFVDGGYFSRPPDLIHEIASQEKLLYGYGIGTNLETSLGIFRVSFALGEGDSFSTAKIHFGLANSF